MTGTGEQVMFWILGPLAVLGALGLVFAKKAVHAALGMALTMIILGVFYIAQDAEDLHSHLSTVDTPFNQLVEKDLCPGAGMLEKINAALR